MAATNATNFSNIQVPIFEGENYEFWAIKMRTLFQSIDAWELVDVGFEEPQQETRLTEAEKKELRKKRSLDAGALSMIQRGVSDALFPRIMRSTKAKEAWDILKQEFHGDDKVLAVKLQNLRRDYENLKMKENELLDEFFGRVIQVVNQMKTCGEKIVDKNIVEKILNSLTEKFDAMVVVIEQTKDTAEMSVQELMGSLKSFEQRLFRRSEKSVESAFQSKLSLDVKNQDKGPSINENQRIWSPRGGRYGRGRGRGTRGRGRSNNESRPVEGDSMRRCNICNKGGHIAKDCWFKGKPQCHHCKKFGHIQKDCKFKNDHQVNFMEDKDCEGNLFYVCNEVMEESKDLWYLDSGCSNHMTPCKEIFLDMDETINSKVKLGNGAAMEVKGKGRIGVATKKGTKVINDVLYVPSLDQSLLSLGQLLEHSYSVLFKDLGCVILDQRNEKVVDIKMGLQRSFPLRFKYSKEVALKASLIDDSWLWHRRFGHLNFRSLKLLQQQNLVHGLPSIQEKNEVCGGCALGKQHRQSFPKGVAWRAKGLLELVHTDVCGPMNTPSHFQNRYFILFIDDYSRMTWVYFMRQRSEVFSIFKKFKSLVEKQSGCSIKILRSDRGKEYTSNEFEKFCEDEGVQRQLTVGYTPQQNGVSERKNQTVMEMAKSMLFEVGLPRRFWAEAVYTAVYLINRSPTKALKNETPFEAWSGRKPSVKHLRVFGCMCYVHVPKEKRHKLDETSEKCILVGYSSKSKGYRLFNLKTNKIIVSRDVVFDEKKTWNWEKSQAEEKFVPMDVIQQNQIQEEESDNEEPNFDMGADLPSSSSSSPSSTPKKMRSLSDVYARCNFCMVEPENFEEAVEDESWRKAMEEEIDAIEENNTWQLVDHPQDKEVIGLKWIYKVKHNPEGSIQRCKARLVAKGYSQQPGIDYNETFAPVARLDTVRAIIAVAAHKGWLLHQLDVKSAFLNGELMEDVYVEQPQGFVVKGEEHKVYKLKKALYGLKQAPRAWYSQIDGYFLEKGFERSRSEPTLYVKNKGVAGILVVVLYVDDLVITGDNEKLIEEFKNEMMRRYAMNDMGLLHYFLGIEVYQGEDAVVICQRRFAEKILKKFRMEGSKFVETPLIVNEKMMKEDGGNKVDATLYRSLVGNLIYLTATRPDLMHATNLLSRFMHSPSHIHLGTAKRVLRYVHGTMNYGLRYERISELKLAGFCDSDWGGCVDDMKSTSGYAFSLGSGVFSWCSKKQQSVAQSSAEAEYVSAGMATSQAIWLRRILEDIGEKQEDPTVLYCDNKSAIAIANNPVFHSRTRHIALKYHFIREAMEDGEVQLVFCRSEEQVADIFTKALPRMRFQQLRAAMGVADHHIKGENVNDGKIWKCRKLRKNRVKTYFSGSPVAFFINFSPAPFFCRFWANRPLSFYVEFFSSRVLEIMYQRRC